jgi:predicted Zn-dependent protease
MRLIRHAIAAGFAGFLAAGCGAPEGAEPQRNTQFEQQQSRQILADLEEKDLLWEDPALDRYLARIADRIDRRRPPETPDLKIHVIKDPNVNAFTSGAGNIFFNAGMIALMENEAQLAMVLAHEAAHIDEGHVTEGLQQRQQVGLVGAIAGAVGLAAGLPNEVVRLGVGLGSQYVVSDFSRDQEREADRVGIEYLADAGYNAFEGAQSFEVMRSLYGEQGGVAAFFATHPRSSERQSELESRAAQLGAERGRVAAQRYLRQTADLRREALDWYERNNRDAFAAQARRNLRRMN